MRIETGVRLVAPEAERIRFGTADGTELTIAPRGAVSVVENRATKRFALLRGAIHVHVRKLGPGERFIIDTADAEIEVRGTTFEVVLVSERPPCGAATLTRVSVWEGVVVVRRPSGADEVRTGEQWPPRCPALMGSPTTHVEPQVPSQRASAQPRRPERSLAAAHGASATSRVEDRSGAMRAARTELEAQNDLFEAAVRAERRGDAGQALKLLDRFVRSYPNAGLIESAYVRRMRVLAARDPNAAAAAAAQYLERFSDGFARAEAQSLRAAAGRP
jgi:hypothetical protein